MTCNYVSLISNLAKNEPQHDKTNKVTVRPAKTQISLGIRPVFLLNESSLDAHSFCWFCHVAAQMGNVLILYDACIIK